MNILMLLLQLNGVLVVGLESLQGRPGLVLQSRLSPFLWKSLQSGCRGARPGNGNLPILRRMAALTCLNTSLLFLTHSGCDLGVSRCGRTWPWLVLSPSSHTLPLCVWHRLFLLCWCCPSYKQDAAAGLGKSSPMPPPFPHSAQDLCTCFTTGRRPPSKKLEHENWHMVPAVWRLWRQWSSMFLQAFHLMGLVRRCRLGPHVAREELQLCASAALGEPAP